MADVSEDVNEFVVEDNDDSFVNKWLEENENDGHLKTLCMRRWMSRIMRYDSRIIETNFA